MIETRFPPRDWREPATQGNGESHAIRSLQDRMNDLFEEMWEKIGKHHTAVSGRALSGHRPQADLSEGHKDWRIEIETPGMEDSDLEVILGEGTVTVRGEKTVEREETGRNYYLAERRSGSISRTFELPADAETKKITATYRNGVLTIDVPKKAGAKSGAKKVPIKSK